MATTVSAHKGGAAASKSSIISGGDSSTADTVAAAAAPPPPPFLPESMRLPQVHPPPPPEPSEAPPPPPPESGYMTKFLLWARKGVSKSAHGNKGDEEEEEERRAREMRHKRAVAAAAAFREALDRHENRIRSLQGERAKIRDEMTRDLRRWERYAIEELEVLGQRTMAIRLINIGARLDLESAYLQALVGILNKIQVWIRQGCDENNTPTGVDLEVFLKGVESGIEVDEIIQFPNLNHNLSECKRLEQESSSLLQKYREMVDQLVVKEAFSARKKRLVRVLQIGDGAAEWDETYGRYWRAESAESRRLFRAIMLDERQSEGQLIRRWRALLHAAGGGGGGGGSNVSPDAVRAFFLHILRQTAGRYALTTERQIGALDLLMARLVYPLISFVVCNLHTPHEYQMDLKFLDNSRLLRCVAASKLGVLPCHLPRRNGEGGGGGGGGGEKEGKGRYQETTSYHQQKQEEQPYHDACHALSEMGRTVVPADMLQAGLQAIRLIRETSSRYFMGHLNGGEAGEGGGKGGVKSGDSTDAADDDERERSAMMKQKALSSLNADALFPIVVYVLLHSMIGDIHACLGTIERFCNEIHLTRGETGMCLSLLRAAASHIVHADLSKFGIDRTSSKPSSHSDDDDNNNNNNNNMEQDDSDDNDDTVKEEGEGVYGRRNNQGTRGGGARGAAKNDNSGNNRKCNGSPAVGTGGRKQQSRRRGSRNDNNDNEDQPNDDEYEGHRNGNISSSSGSSSSSGRNGTTSTNSSRSSSKINCTKCVDNNNNNSNNEKAPRRPRDHSGGSSDGAIDNDSRRCKKMKWSSSLSHRNQMEIDDNKLATSTGISMHQQLHVKSASAVGLSAMKLSPPQKQQQHQQQQGFDVTLKDVQEMVRLQKHIDNLKRVQLDLIHAGFT